MEKLFHMDGTMIKLNLLMKYISLITLWESHFVIFRKSMSDRGRLAKSDDSEIFFDVEIYGDEIAGYISRLIPSDMERNQQLPDFKFVYNNIKNKSLLSHKAISLWINNKNNIVEYPTYSQYILTFEEIILQAKKLLQYILVLKEKEQIEIWQIINKYSLQEE